MTNFSDDIRATVVNAIYEALVDDVSCSVTTMAAKCTRVDSGDQDILNCEIINYPDAGSVARWSMEVGVVESVDDYDLLVGAIRHTMERIKMDSSPLEPITD